MLPKPAICSYCQLSYDSRMQLFRHLRDPLSECSTKANLNENITEKVCLLFGYFGPPFVGAGAKYNHQYNNSNSNNIDKHKKNYTNDANSESNSKSENENENNTSLSSSSGVVETTILSALSLVSKCSLPSLDNLCLSLASHTDKGIHACMNVLACKLKAGLCHAEFVSRINQQLPPSIRVFGAMPVPANFHASVFCERKRYEYWVPLSFFTQPGGLVSPSSHSCLLSDRSLTNWTHSLACSPSSIATAAITNTTTYSLDKGEHFLIRQDLDFNILAQMQFEISVKFSGKATLRFALRQRRNGSRTIISSSCSSGNGGSDSSNSDNMKEVWYVAAREQMLTEVSHLLGNLNDVKWQQFDVMKNRVMNSENGFCSPDWGGDDNGSDSGNASNSRENCGGRCDSGGVGDGSSIIIDAFGLLISCSEAQTMEMEHIRVLAPLCEREKRLIQEEKRKSKTRKMSENVDKNGEDSANSNNDSNQSIAKDIFISDECDRLMLLAALKPLLKRFVVTSSTSTTTATTISSSPSSANSSAQQIEASKEEDGEEEEGKEQQQQQQQQLSFHNFSRGVSSHEPRAKKQVAFQALGFRRIEGVEYLGFSVSSRRFLFGMPLKMMGLILSLARNLLPASVLDACFDPSLTLDLPSAPSHLLLLAECAYGRFEVGAKMQINPRLSSYTKGFIEKSLCEEMFMFRNSVLREIHYEETKNNTLECWLQTQASVQAACVLEKLQKPSSLTTTSLSTQSFSLCPPVFARALRLLRAADKSGLWPSSSVRRSALLEQGGSFTLGYMPPPLSPPAANSMFPELYEALMQLEARLCPSRPPSSTIAVNRHASFRPHRDSGAGAGQGISLIVGLGDYEGGELSCDPLNTDGPPEIHGIRYRPLLFHGWDQRHWTLPFVGERFSIVWFTPKGCEQWQTQVPIPTLLPNGLCSCCARCIQTQEEGRWVCWYCDPSNRTTWKCAFSH